MQHLIGRAEVYAFCVSKTNTTYYCQADYVECYLLPDFKRNSKSNTNKIKAYIEKLRTKVKPACNRKTFVNSPQNRNTM